MAIEDEYKEMFLAEATANCEEIDQLLTQLEKNPHNPTIVDNLFRVTHTLKGNAMGMELEGITKLSHVLEDLFGIIKKGKLVLDTNLFQVFFRASDILTRLVQAIKDDTVVRYKGILTKLKVILRKAEEQNQLIQEPVKPAIPNEIDAPKGASTNEIEHKIAISDTIQVPVQKLDELMNIVGEILIVKDTFIAESKGKGNNTSLYTLEHLHRLTSDLQYSVMNVRLVKVGFLFNKFHRILRDAAVVEQKQVDLVLKGTECEIDRSVFKVISDSLVHLVRNAVGHGIETESERLKAGKPARGTITLNARGGKSSILIEVTDDGYGIDIEQIKRKALERGLILEANKAIVSEEDVLMCLFEPGFSNTEKITELSGRGVGLDAVKMTVESIGGQIQVESKFGVGTTFTMNLPASMLVKPVLLFQVQQQEFAIPLSHIEAVIALSKTAIHKTNAGLVARYLSKVISIVFLTDLFAMNSIEEMDNTEVFFAHFDQQKEEAAFELVIVNHNHRLVGFVVDKLLQQKEIIEKKLPPPLHNAPLFSGATILGTGKTCLVLDIARIMTHLFKEKRLG